MIYNNGEERNSAINLYSIIIYLIILRTILTIVVINDFEYKVFDIIVIFLNTIVSEDINIFIKQPKDFKNGTKQVYKFYKTLYSLRKSFR